ncbi:MAG: FecR family protein [Bacteroidota bacterium]
MDQLIVKYLQNELTLQEQHELSKWLAEDENNADTLRKIETYWKDHGDDLIDKEQRVRDRLVNRIVAEKTNAETPSSSNSLYQLLRLAAIVVLGLSVAFSIYILNTETPVQKVSLVNSMIEKQSQRGEKLTIKLPDGSTVKLNSGSSIIYPEVFSENSREVVLNGEGFFDIVKNPDQPFIVHVDEVRVKVLGTSFNINTAQSSKEVAVGVKTGLVKVSNKSETISRILNPLEMVVCDEQGKLLNPSKIRDPELIFGWTDQLLVFNDAQVSEILTTVSNWFGVEFILDKNIDSKRVYTSKFNNPTLNTVLNSLSYVYDFEYEINDKTIIIK